MYRITRSLLTLAIVSAVVSAQSAQAATFTVTKPDDTDATNVGTLRWAITEANASAGLDTIAFAIGSGAQTIKLTAALPMLSGDQTQINGATQPGYNGTPLIRIDGSALPPTTRGLYLRGDQLVVNALSLTGFGGAAVFGDQFTADGAVVGCYIGLQQDGSTVAANGVGIYMDGTGYYLGGTTPATRNVVSGNTTDGIQIGANGTDNRVWGSYIGTDATATSARPNGTGVQIGGSGNVVGDITANKRNIISGNVDAGLRIDGSTNQVFGNYIGLAPNGVTRLPNEAQGVLIYGDDNSIGGAGGGGNVISGNTGVGLMARFVEGLTLHGNRIGTNALGTAAATNGKEGIYIESSTGFAIGDSASGLGNQISGNTRGGLYVTGNSGGSGSINGNVIGLAADGNGALGNAGDGITISSLSNHVLEIRGNVIASNLYNGVTANAGVVEVVANRIGVNVAGNAARGNVTGVGVGGAVVSIRENQISGNETGITANSNVAEIEILDNRIGTDVAGNVAIGNTSSGLRISRAAPGLALGSPGHGNQISGNYRGITLDDITAEVIVQGNNIGLNAARTAKLGNVETAMLFGGNAHQIGGIAAGAGNVIAGNGSPAMRIGDGGGHHIEGNFIGTNAALASGLGNGFGIVIATANDVIVGGTAVGAGNVIINNTFSGVRLEGGQRNAVLGNRVYDNAEYNIDIVSNAGPSSNDSGDVDQGPNLGQNFPEIISATVNGANLQFTGKLRSRGNTSYRIEYFQSSQCHVTGMGQGRSYIGHETVLTNASGVANLGFLGSNGQNSGYVTATATDPDGNTSEYGNCVAIGQASKGEFAFMTLWQFGYEDLGYVDLVVTRSKGASGAVSVQFSTADHAPATAVAGSDYVAKSTTLNFADGETSQIVRVVLLADTDVEGMQDFDVKLSAPTAGATLGALANARAVIYDHDPQMIQASIDDVIVSEPVNGTANATFTVIMGADVSTRTINYTTVDATANAGSDFVATSGSLTFLPGETTKAIVVPVKADEMLEDDEYFELELSESDATMQLLRGTGIGAILNTGGAPILFKDGFGD